MRQLRNRWALLALLLAALPLEAVGGQGYAKKILNADSEGEKGEAAVRGRKSGLDAENVLAVIQGEKMVSIAAMVTGMYLEKGDFEGPKTLAVLTAFAARDGQWGKASVMAACSPHREEIIEGLLESGSEKCHALAASALAAHAYAKAVAAELEQPAAKGDKDKKKGGAVADVADAVAKLLAGKSKDAAELAVLAAAYARDQAPAEAIERLEDTRSPTLAAARLLYLARTGAELPEALTRKVLALRGRVPKRAAQLSPHLHSYDLRGNPLTYACQAVAAAADERFLGEMHALLGHPDLRVQMDATRAIEAIGSQTSVPVLLKRLEQGTPWPVKMLVLYALGAIPSRDSVPRLLALLKSERGRFRQDAAYALASICPPLAKLHLGDWHRWWDENGEAFQVDIAATRDFRRANRVQDIQVPPLADFYGGKILSDRVVFVLDTSKSMRGEKIKALKRNMAATLEDLPPHVEFNVVDFGGRVSVMKPGSLIDARQRSHARQLVDYMELTLGTRTFEALEAAVRLPGMDTAVYLSDGAPVGGQFEAWRRITRAFDIYNRYRPVAMHCILYAPGAGGKKKKRRGKAGRMQELADHHRGLMTVAGEGG
jgi:hypothetical protein